jgi:hypothetical protein
MISNSAQAQAAPLGCNVNQTVNVTTSTVNAVTCTIILPDGRVRISNSSLSNTNTGELTNNGKLINEANDGFGLVGNPAGYNFNNDGIGSELNTAGSLVNNGYLLNSGVNGISTLTNETGAVLTNNGELYNETRDNDSNSTLNNLGTLTNNYHLHNESFGVGSTSTITNAAGAEIKNKGLLVNGSYDGGTSTLTNSGKLTNSGIYNKDSENEIYGGLYNISEGEDSKSTLTNSGTLTNTAILINDSYYGGESSLNNEAGATLTNEGYLGNSSDYHSTSTLTNKAGAILTNKAGATLNNESGSNYGSGASTLTNEGNLINNGYLDNFSYDDGTSTLDNTGTLINNGTIYNNASITNSGTFDITTYGAMVNYGTFTQTAGSTIVNGSIYGGTMDIKGGSLSGSGTIEAESITIGEDATVKPGNSPGTLIMISDLELLGTLQTEIFSSIMGDYDVLEVQGTVTLSDDSLFDFLFDDSYVETDGDSFDFLTASDFVFGTALDFDSWFDRSNFSITGLAAGFGWSVSYTDSSNDQTSNYLSLDIFADDSYPNAVSAPATVGLFGLALTLIGWGGRRRSKLRSRTA